MKMNNSNFSGKDKESSSLTRKRITIQQASNTGGFVTQANSAGGYHSQQSSMQQQNSKKIKGTGADGQQLGGAHGYAQAAANQQDFSLKQFANQPIAQHNMKAYQYAQLNNFLENDQSMVNYTQMGHSGQIGKNHV